VGSLVHVLAGHLSGKFTWIYCGVIYNPTPMNRWHSDKEGVGGTDYEIYLIFSSA